MSSILKAKQAVAVNMCKLLRQKGKHHICRFYIRGTCGVSSLPYTVITNQTCYLLAHFFQEYKV